MVERRQVSKGRKFAFYCGYLSMAAGLALLIFTVATLDLTAPSRIRAAGFRVLAGLGLLGAGLLLRRVGIRGLAGSLLILDPPRAKEDLEPWSRAAGGLVDAGLSEVSIAREAAERLAGKEKIRLRCPRCRALNDDGAERCQGCGEKL